MENHLELIQSHFNYKSDKAVTESESNTTLCFIPFWKRSVSRIDVTRYWIMSFDTSRFMKLSAFHYFPVYDLFAFPHSEVYIEILFILFKLWTVLLFLFISFAERMLFLGIYKYYTMFANTWIVNESKHYVLVCGYNKLIEDYVIRQML